jgi:hypothetical protein
MASIEKPATDAMVNRRPASKSSPIAPASVPSNSDR